jgi:hypothetical protein
VKRFVIGPVGAVLLLIVLPLTLSSCNISCACDLPPTFSPAPVNPLQAGQDAAKFASVPSMSAGIVAGLDGRYFYRATAANRLAFVDAESGIVLELVLTDQMPNDSTASKSGADARGAAETFMSGTGLSTQGMTESADLKTVAGVSAYEITWNDAAGVHAGKFEVSVNAATGNVFAYVDLRMQLALTPPIVGSSRATALAVAAAGIPGETARSVDFAIDFATGVEVSTWRISLSVPGAAAGSYEHVAVVTVDAVSGTATEPAPPVVSPSGASPLGNSPTPQAS